MVDADALWSRMHVLAAEHAGARLDLDLAEVPTVDGVMMALLVELRAELVASGRTCEIVDANQHVEPLVHLLGGDEAPTSPSTAPAHHGNIIARLLEGVVRGNWRSLPQLVERAGADGLPIVILLNFLVGFVMSSASH